MLQAYDYDPYGNTQQVSGSKPTDMRYAGMYLHQPSGLYLTHYRFYDPKTTRWLNRDPIGYAGGLNLYGYVGNNPLNYTDRSGLVGETLAWCWGGPQACAIGAGVVVISAGVIWANYWLNRSAAPNKDLEHITFDSRSTESKPKNCPRGTKPIDQVKDLDKDEVHGVKEGIGAGPKDWTGITPDGHVISGDKDGNAVDHGPVEDWLP